MERIQKILSAARRERLLAVCEELLLIDLPPIPFRANRQWPKGFVASAGLYAIFEFQELVYVGESGSLRGRMRDLLDTRNHTFRRSLGMERFGGLPGFQRATGSQKFPEHIEGRLNEYMEGAVAVSTLELSFGRREVEEALISRHTPLFNVKTKRV